VNNTGHSNRLPLLTSLSFLLSTLLTWTLITLALMEVNYTFAFTSLLALVLYGAFASLFVARSKEKGSRIERMRTQCGHTIMLFHFWGIGPVTELVQHFRGMSTKQSVIKSCNFHFACDIVVQCVLRYCVDNHLDTLSNSLILIVSFAFILIINLT
jgi:hypothetical protein